MVNQKVVDVLGASFAVQILNDRNIFDTVDVQPATTGNIIFFQSTQGKQLHQANFPGDATVVKEGRMMEVIALTARFVHHEAAFTPFIRPQLEQFPETSSFTWNVAGVQFERDVLRSIMGGLQFIPVFDLDAQPAPADRDLGYWGSGCHDDVRIYGERKIIPGGREMEFFVTPHLAAGTPNTDPWALQINLYGNELVPLEEV